MSPRFHHSAALPIAILLTLTASVASCHARRRPLGLRELPRWEDGPQRGSRAAPSSRRLVVEKYPTRDRDIIIYPVQSGRAEDLAATLEPLFAARFGPGVRVIPHVPTNQLFIYIPRSPGDDGRSGPAPSPPQNP